MSSLPAKRLVVTADDAGLHRGMTDGVLAAHRRGIVTAVAVASAGADFEGAVERLREAPGLDVGIHWVLVGERPLSPPEAVPSLLGGGGALLPAAKAFTRRYLLGRLRMSEVEREMRLQLERLLATGLPVVHANSHQHLHLLPRVFEIALRICQEHGIPWVRIPAEPAAGLGSPRGIEISVLNALGRRARRRIERTSGLSAPDATVGVLDAGRLHFEQLVRALLQVRGTSELVCHPGLREADLALSYDWDYGWEEETQALCDPRLSPFLREAGIELTSFSRAGGTLSAPSPG